jgi:septal ring factor EnvC (AmiA/AmiB activator)
LRIWFFIFAFWVAFCQFDLAKGAPVANEPDTGTGTETEADLKALNSQIAKYKKTAATAQSKAEKIAAELAAAKQKTVVAAAAVQEYEASLSNLEKELSALEDEQSAVKAKLDERFTQMQTLTASLEILAKSPTEAMFSAPLSPQDMAKSAVLMRGTIPVLESVSKDLRAELIRLSSLKMAIKAKRAQIKMAFKGLGEKNQRLAALILAKKEEEKKLLGLSETAKERIAELSKKAKNIEDILKANAARKLKEQQEKEKAEAAKKAEEMNLKKYISPAKGDKNALSGDFAKAKGVLSMPAAGSISSRFDEINQNGMHNKGITIRTRAGAQVISPYDGTVIFAGFLKGYGKLLIIEHNGNYFTTLAGMGQIDAEEGQTLLAGEPVGTMEQREAPELYMELRKADTPINPLPWLALKS